ncbi:polysaccharide deacetylase family protein [Marinicella sediminis]|uniref:Polysaccharide deacetylase family protein n=1 Tax=Marinicella sediminis TaxID=1792834 RepID=A0ABV7JBQ5_9GAMM|nr:polysaccharide deacetylase family protein [Marinicella sediminis]
MKGLRIPVLTYHANNITGTAYAENDHTALKTDLNTLHEHGFQVIPLLWVAEWVQGKRNLGELNNGKLVAISCDDGLNLDYESGNFLDQGQQPGFFQILQSFIDEVGKERQPHAHLTSFVIASPKARRAIESHSLEGQQLMSDKWWKAASDSPLFSIENHSWDHRHPAIYDHREADFRNINCETLADQQILFAGQQITKNTGLDCQLFCFPFGQYNEYLIKQYLPEQQQKHQLTGAFSCDPKAVTRDSNPWCLPRFVCGLHWQSTADLTQLVLGITD